MSKKKFILIVLSLSFIAFVSSSFLTSSYKQATLMGIKWSTTNSNGAVVKVRNANLPSTYADALAPGYKKWNDSSARINVSSTTSIGIGVVSFHAAPQTTWSLNGWGTGEAWAQPMDTEAGVYCAQNYMQHPADKCSKITDGIVWINSSNISSDSKRREAVVAHEIGHMVGLLHRTNAIHASLMCNKLECPSKTYDVQVYDIQDINSMY